MGDSLCSKVVYSTHILEKAVWNKGILYLYSQDMQNCETHEEWLPPAVSIWRERKLVFIASCYVPSTEQETSLPYLIKIQRWYCFISEEAGEWWDWNIQLQGLFRYYIYICWALGQNVGKTYWDAYQIPGIVLRVLHELTYVILITRLSGAAEETEAQWMMGLTLKPA